MRTTAVLSTLFVGALSAQITFTDVTGAAGLSPSASPESASWADYDCDGDDDLYIGAYAATGLRLWRNDGTTFTNVTAAAGIAQQAAWGAAWDDYNADGWIDLYISGRNAGTSKLYANSGVGTFTDVTAAAGAGYADISTSNSWADVDADGDPDIYVFGAYSSVSKLMRNDGGTFTDISAGSNLDVATSTSGDNGHAWGDYDGDHLPDVALGSTNTDTRLFRNQGGGVWQDVTAAAGIGAHRSIGSRWIDYDNDGLADLAVIDVSGARIWLYRNNGNGTFTETSGALGLTGYTSPITTVWADYDRDGNLDVFISGNGSTYLYRNDGTSFADVTAGSGLTNLSGGHGGATADYDRDGDSDIVGVAYFGSYVRLWRNDQTANNWLELNLVGDGAAVGRIATGSKATVYWGSNLFAQWVDGGYGGHGQEGDQKTLFYGIGTAASVDSVVVNWTDGTDCSAPGSALVNGVNARYSVGYPCVVDTFVACMKPVAIGTAERGASARGSLVARAAPDGLVLVLALARAADVTLSLYDAAGHEVERRPLGTLGAGEHTLRAGRNLPSGVYLVRARAARSITRSSPSLDNA